MTPRGETHLGRAAELLSEKARSRAAVFLFSDLFDPDPEGLERVLQLRHMKNELAVFHTLDPAELEFPYDDPTLFQSMEDSRQLSAHPAEIRASYLEELQVFLDGTQRRCAEAAVGYQRVASDAALDKLLVGFLAQRERRARSGGR